MRVLAFLLPVAAFAYLPSVPDCTTCKPESIDLFCSFDFLYWEGAEQGLEYAFKNVASQANQNLSVYQTHPRWEPAFRLGIGGHLPHAHWDLGFTYTFFNTTANDAAEDNSNLAVSLGPGLISSWTYPSAFGGNGVGVRFGRAEAAWKLVAQMLDAALSRSFFLGKDLVITPGFGVRSAFLHQHYNLSYSGGNTIPAGLEAFSRAVSSTIEMGNLSNTVGPMLMLGSRWNIAEHWDFCSTFSASMLASYFSVYRKEADLLVHTDTSLHQESIRLKSDYWAFYPQGQLLLGVRFSDCSYRKQDRPIAYSVGVSYEAQIFWKQNQFLRYIGRFEGAALSASAVPTQGDLLFHGFTLDIRGDF